MKSKSMQRIAVAGLALLAMMVPAHAAGTRTAEEHAALLKHVADIRAGRDNLPLHLSTDRKRNETIGGVLRDLLREGGLRAAQDARQERHIYTVVDDARIKATPVGERPYEEHLIARVHQDRANGRFVVGPEMNDSGGLGSAAWFFYRQYFVAYAGFQQDFRKADSPLARGIAALAAFDMTYRSDLCLLPDFKPEAAIALLLLNVDPELVTHLRNKSPADPDLRARMAVALGKTGAANPEVKAAALLGDPRSNLPVRPFILTAFVGEDPAARDAMWRSALETIPYPGLLAEIGIAAWLRRPMDPKAVGELNKVFTERMLNVLDREFGARGIARGDVTKKAIFDVSQLTTVFGFVWTYRPEFEAWRKDVNAGASIRDKHARDTQRNALKRRLAGLLAEKANPAEQLCALLATHPLQSGGRQPNIEMAYVERTGGGKSDAEKVLYIETARLTLTWQSRRPLRSFTDTEQIVFVGATTEKTQDQGIPVHMPERKPTVEDDKSPEDATGKGPDKPGQDEGKRTGQSGMGDGRHGPDGEGEDDAVKPPELVDSRGFAGDTPVLWRARADAEDSRLPIAEAVKKGFGATLVRDPLAPAKPDGDNIGLATVWSEFAAVAIEPNGKAIRFEFDNGQVLVAGSAQELAMMPKGRDSIGFKQAKAIQVEDSLVGEDGKTVRVVQRIAVEDPTALVVPSMAVYENLLVAGVLGKAGVLQHVGGILADMRVETPSGHETAKRLRKGTLVSAWHEEERGAARTQMASVLPLPADVYVELSYKAGGEERVLKIAATQKVLVWNPQTREQTYACANPELLRVPKNKDLREKLEGHKEAPMPGDGSNRSSERSAMESARGAASEAAKDAKADRQPMLRLVPGMLLVTDTTGKNEDPVTTPLKSITAVGVKAKEAKSAEDETSGTKYDTYVPEVINLRLLRVEGILLHFPTRFENTRGFVEDTLVTQPPQGMAPGQPLNLTEGMKLPATSIRNRGLKAFLTTKFPEKLWMPERVRDTNDKMSSLRLVRIETPRGSLLCGNKQLFVVAYRRRAVDEAGRRIEVFAEEIIHDPKAFHLLFLDRGKVRAGGELDLVPITAAAYVYEADRVRLCDIAGDGFAGVIELKETGPDGKPVNTTIKQDIYFANGFMALTENEKSTKGGGSLTGGGGGKGKIAPEGKSTQSKETRVTFTLPGLEAGSQRTRESRILFTADERAQFAAGLQRVQDTYAQAEWGAVKDRQRFTRFLGLYFSSTGADLEAVYNKSSEAGGPPAWTAAAFREYIESRAYLLEYGNPADLYDWSFRYVFLVTLAYETRNAAWGDALMQDFLCITMTVALGRTTEQKDRDRYYDDSRWRLAEALHWTRDVVSIVRDGGDGRQAWVAPAGWEHLLKEKLPVLTAAPESTEGEGLSEGEGCGIAAVYRDGKVEIGNLWMQLSKFQQGSEVAPQMSGDMDPEVAAAVAGRGEYRTSYSIVSPTETAADAFGLAPYGKQGPYANRKGIREVLGIRVGDPSF